ncbi:hypothetical protein [Acidipila sp. EB88]|uniref:hypothetical protein n=1 Tax=Acidipila sp. EB88 TaxID=2305226 RepID=UPI000F5F44A2|nr:hypothetical protein [Acidipila sp. EB88]RRA47960.1 hypothetical protein D1Y84_06325 [Acidipila sp. EB88]
MSRDINFLIIAAAACWCAPALLLATAAAKRHLSWLTFFGIGVALGPVLSFALVHSGHAVPAAAADRAQQRRDLPVAVLPAASDRVSLAPLAPNAAPTENAPSLFALSAARRAATALEQLAMQGESPEPSHDPRPSRRA